ncbi:MAG: DNA-formamidopyrimidine glycosylase [Trichlorobacter sp.]
MPELPEVESVRRTLVDGTPSLLGAVVWNVDILRASVVDGLSTEQLRRQVEGATVHEVFRHGKYLFFRLSNARGTNFCWMAVHLRMTGRLFLVSEESAIAPHTRFVLHLENRQVLRFDDPRAFGRVWLVSDPAEVISRLGPDALAIGKDMFLQRLSGQRRQLKPLLLDQSFVAGLGNIYVDESLFRARLHPLQSVTGLRGDERERLFAAVHEVLQQAVDCKGANIDGVFEAGNFPVAVYGRNGTPCPVCGSSIVKLRVAQRGTHLCPSCQPMN